MKKGSILLMVFLCAFISCSQSQTLDEFSTHLESKNKAMGTISIFKNGKEVYHKSIGFANLEKQKKANKNTLYRIGSVTKTFTSTIILQLVEEGKINLDEKLATYFPDIPNAENITIKHMLYHRSGLYNITNEKGFESWISKPRDRKQMLARIKKYQSDFKPDSKSAYSNTNYILLSYIAEIVEKKTFNKILKKRISNKIGLKNTYFQKDLDLSKNEAMCYYPENGVWKPITYHTDLTGPMGAGAITSTAKDVATFYNALFNGKIISQKSIKQMTTPQDEMGMGVSVANFNGETIYGHNGAIDGFRSMVVYIPQKKLTIAFTFNALSVSSTDIIITLYKSYLQTIKQNK